MAVLLVTSAIAAGQPGPTIRPQAVATREDSVDCDGFKMAVQRYVSLRAQVLAEVPPLRVTKDVTEILQRSDALAYSIQRARRNAEQGEFFDDTCARTIAEQFAHALNGFDVADFMVGLQDEPSDRRPPEVHMRYPRGASMATMPANLLNVLPELPNWLEYRLIGRDLVLRDVDAALILDYFTDAMPAARLPRR